jgi:hypothetical protein
MMTATTVITVIITVIRTTAIPIVMGLSALTMAIRVTDITGRIIRPTDTAIIRARSIDPTMVDAVDIVDTADTAIRITAEADCRLALASSQRAKFWRSADRSQPIVAGRCEILFRRSGDKVVSAEPYALASGAAS